MRGFKCLVFVGCICAATVVFSCRSDNPPGAAPSNRPDGSQTPASPAATASAGGGKDHPSALGRYDLGSAPDAVISLPSPLREVSGIVVTENGTLLAHNDERGIIYRVDASTGEIVGQFGIGERSLRGDFEDLAVARGTIYLVNSSGQLFSFGEGRDRENVPFASHPTRLGPKNDVEGLCYDPATGTLLLACKGDPGTGAEDVRAVYAFDERKGVLLPSPRFIIDLGELKRNFGLKNFMPSAIGRHPSGNFFLLSAAGNSIIELSPGGTVLSYANLPGKYHSQPEGIAFDSGGRLFIADEGEHRGKIAVYRSRED